MQVNYHNIVGEEDMYLVEAFSKGNKGYDISFPAITNSGLPTNILNIDYVLREDNIFSYFLRQIKFCLFGGFLGYKIDRL